MRGHHFSTLWVVTALLLFNLGSLSDVVEAAQDPPTVVELPAPIHADGTIYGETRIEVVAPGRIAIAVDQDDALAPNKGVDYLAYLDTDAQLEQPPSFWGQATVEFRRGTLLVAPAGDDTLYRFWITQPANSTVRADIATPSKAHEVSVEGWGLVYEPAPEGMVLSQLKTVSQQGLDHFFEQDPGAGGGGGCATSCSIACMGGDSCSASCGLGRCASCSCSGGSASCSCK